MSLRLLSPDGGDALFQDGEVLVDSAGRRYERRGDAWDLRPKSPVRATVTYGIDDTKLFREFPFTAGLTPLFPDAIPAPQGFKERMIAPFLPPSRPGDLALDHGCGGGTLRKFFEERGYGYVGADDESGSDSWQGGGARFAGGATHLCDLHCLPFGEGAFRFCVSYSVFEHLQVPQAAADSLRRVLAPGGIAFVAVAALLPFHMGSFYHHTHYGVLKTFRSAGFEVLQVAPADWDAYSAISAMDGLPGPALLRRGVSAAMGGLHKVLWRTRAWAKRRDRAQEELRRRLVMASMIKAVLRVPGC